MEKYIIIADDLSGACDTAVQFSNWGYKTLVVNQGEKLTVDIPYKAVAITSNSRDVSPQKARTLVAGICK